MADVIGHPWMQGPIATADEVKLEFQQRHEKLLVEQKEEADRKAAVRQQHRDRRHGATRGDKIGNAVYMSGVSLSEIEESKEEVNVVHLQLDSYDPIIAKQTQFMSSYEPEYLMKHIIDKLREDDINA